MALPSFSGRTGTTGALPATDFAIFFRELLIAGLNRFVILTEISSN